MRIAKLGTITIDNDLVIDLDGFDFIEVNGESMEQIVAFTLRFIADEVLKQEARHKFLDTGRVVNHLPI